MAISVGELVSIPSLATRLLAGASSADRLISWAHVCELPQPWEWMGHGDLLMTTGLGVPADPADQVTYVEQMAAVGAAGIAIGEAMHAPPISAAMLEAADRAGLPLLMTRQDVPFIALARTVAGASAREVQSRLTTTERIYEHMRNLATSEDPMPLIVALGKELHHRLVILEPGRVLDERGSRRIEDDPEAAQVLRHVRESSTRRGGLVRITEPFDGLAASLPTPYQAFLVARPLRGQTDISLVQHAAAALATQRALADAGRERSRRLGSSLLARLLDGTVDSTVAIDELAERLLAARRVLLATSAIDTDEWADLHHYLDAEEIPNLLLGRAEAAFVLVPEKAEAIDAVSHGLGEQARIGVSEPFDRVSETKAASLQALWALRLSVGGGDRVTVYSPTDPSDDLLPASMADRERLARRVLGPLLAYDEEKSSQLLPSLRVFLEENRSWQRAAPRLHVHKQTLVYRMERVEQLTGRQLDSTADVAELWLAVQAAMTCGLLRN